MVALLKPVLHAIACDDAVLEKSTLWHRFYKPPRKRKIRHAYVYQKHTTGDFTPFTEQDKKWMHRALQLAAEGAVQGEVPVGAVIVANGEVIGQGYNCPVRSCDATHHAEIVALRAATQRLGNYRLPPNATLYVTLEPCTMCVGALIHARISRVVFACAEPRAGALISTQQLMCRSHYNHYFQYAGGLCAPESRQLLKGFFAQKRATPVVTQQTLAEEPDVAVQQEKGKTAIELAAETAHTETSLDADRHSAASLSKDNGNTSAYVKTPDIVQAIHLVKETQDILFITGRAGTGKSTLLQHLKQEELQDCVVIAPTGIAALNAQGSTIHSLFGFPHKLLTENDIEYDERRGKLLASLRYLIIDEVSMVRADVMDAIDLSLRLHRKNTRPFGGIRLILFGDVFQLPPVVEKELYTYFKETYGGFYFFDANVFKQQQLYMHELKTVFRQQQPEFVHLLNRVRANAVHDKALAILNARCTPINTEDAPVTLTATNQRAQHINMDELARIDSATFKYTAKIEGAFDKSSYPTELELQLKVGAKIMLLKNDVDRRYVNGSIGEIVRLNAEQIVVEIEGEKCILKPEAWDALSYKYNIQEKRIEECVVGRFIQYPIKLAWAITIHKSQGLTFDAVCVDLGRGAFAHGQTYVALSRCRTYEKLYLKHPLGQRDVIVDDHVINFYLKLLK